MIAETVGKALLSILYFLLVTCATLGIPLLILRWMRNGEAKRKYNAPPSEQRDDERGENDAR